MAETLIAVDDIENVVVDSANNNVSSNAFSFFITSIFI